MILKPIPSTSAQEAMALAGLTDQKPLEVIKKDGLPDVKTILDARGASLADAAEALGKGLRDEDQRLNAAKLAFQLHGALKEAEKPSIPSIIVNIQNNGESKTLLSLLAPT